MGKLNQPHDKYFRSTFGEVGFAKDFLKNYLPEELLDIIDMNTLDPQPTSYLSKELKEQFTDLLFRVNIMNKEAYVYFLFEHKSYRDRMVIFQVLKYIIAVWEAKIKEDLDNRKEANIIDTGDIEIPIVIPLVVYHDKYKWNVKRTLGEMIPNYSNLSDNIKRYIPDFEYILSDLSYSDKDLDLDPEHSIIIRTLNRARYATKDEIIEIFTEAITIFTKSRDKDMVSKYITETVIYILNSRDDLSKAELFNIAGKISIEGGELVMSLAERLRQEGMQEGKETGELEGTRKAIRKILLSRLKSSSKEVNKILSEIDDEILLDSIMNEALQSKSSDEFESILYNIVR